MNNFFSGKRVLISVIFMSVSFSSWGQSGTASVAPVLPPAPGGIDYVYNGPTAWSTSTRTVTNTGTDTMRFTQSPGILSGPYAGSYYIYNNLSLQWDFTKISGTKGGTLSIYMSNEYNSGQPVNGYQLISTISITTVTPQYAGYVFTGNPGTSYMSVYTGTGTMAVSYMSTLLVR